MEAAARITPVNVLNRMNEPIDVMTRSVEAVTRAAIGPYRKSRPEARRDSLDEFTRKKK
jgi:hypothetical protein